MQPNLPRFEQLPLLTGCTEKGKSIANVKLELKHVKRHVKYLKSMTKRWYCILLKILTYLLSARCCCCCCFVFVWFCLRLQLCLCACSLCNAAMRHVGGMGGGSSKNCMRQRAASNSYDYHNLYGLGDVRQAAKAAKAAAAAEPEQKQKKQKQKERRQPEKREEIFCALLCR